MSSRDSRSQQPSDISTLELEGCRETTRGSSDFGKAKEALQESCIPHGDFGSPPTCKVTRTSYASLPCTPIDL